MAVIDSKKKTFLGVVGVIVLLGAAYFGYQAFTYIKTDNAQVAAHITMLSSRVAGTIKSVVVDENQKVKAGEVLAEVDSADYANAYQAADAQVASLKARFQEAQINYQRTSKLLRNFAVSQEKFDNATAGFKEIEARLKAAQAQLDQASLNVAYTKILAPTDGVIARKSIEPGQYVPMGQPLFGFVETRDRWIIANLKETELKDVKIGATAYITVDAIPGREFIGKVDSVSPSTGAVFSLLPPDNATGNFTKVVQRVPVRIKLTDVSADETDRLQAGLSALVAIRSR